MAALKNVVAWALVALYIFIQIMRDSKFVSALLHDKNGPSSKEGRLHANNKAGLYSPEFDECANATTSTTTTTSSASTRPTTTVIVTSNLIPTMPKTDMLVDTLDSLSYIKGLEPNTAIIITVDGIRPEFDTPKNRERLMEWTYRVRAMFKCHSNVQILTSVSNQGHTNSIKAAIGQVTTEFVYLMEHDFPFIKEIDHKLLINAVRNVPELRIVRFNQRRNRPKDGTDCVQNLNYTDMDFILAKWSNNNHFTTKAYYDWHLSIVAQVRTPEYVMMERGLKNCTLYGMHLYGPKADGPYIHHIDGKRTLDYNRTGKYNNDDLCPRSTDTDFLDQPDSVLPWVRCPNFTTMESM